jgi:hypothetical protein
VDVSGSGTVKMSTVDLSPVPFSMDVSDGAIITLEAVPAFGSAFEGWSGSYTGDDNPAVLTITCDTRLTANFTTDWILIGSISGSAVLIILLAAVFVSRWRKEKRIEATSSGTESLPD